MAKHYSFTAGSTQTVTGSLTLLGASENLLGIVSTVSGSAAFLDLQGTSSTDFVFVEDDDATPGSPIPIGPDSTKGANTEGWVAAALVPVLGVLGVALLAGSLAWGARRALAGRVATH